CTNKPIAITRAILDDLDWSQHFGAVVGGDSTPAKKPDPAPLQAVLDMLGVSPRRALMVGDSAADVGAARALGMQVAVLAHGYSRAPIHEIGADVVLGDLDAVLALAPGAGLAR
ncbi:MAG: HAD-IA family hydrolase, partial [Caulobacterales bacterium]|nr:HAD-IA family hydrolase [Caulobacterales bacterium]